MHYSHGQRIYGLSADAFSACEEIDFRRAIIDGRYAMIMDDDRVTFNGKTLTRSALDMSIADSNTRSPGYEEF